MLIEYLNKSLEGADYKKLEDGTWFAEIPGFAGVWANARTLEECRRELVEVLEEWILLKLQDHEQVPVVAGIDLSMRKAVGA